MRRLCDYHCFELQNGLNGHTNAVTRYFSCLLLLTSAVLADDAWEPSPPWEYGRLCKALRNRTAARSVHFNRNDAYIAITPGIWALTEGRRVFRVFGKECGGRLGRRGGVPRLGTLGTPILGAIHV